VAEGEPGGSWRVHACHARSEREATRRETRPNRCVSSRRVCTVRRVCCRPNPMQTSVEVASINSVGPLPPL
jgi:hypothetical protein